MRIINNQKGFSLTEILVAVGLMGGVSLVSMKLMDNQSGNERMLKAAAEVNKAVSMVQGAISNDASCKNLLEGLTATATPGTSIPILRQKVNFPNGTTGFTELLNTSRNYGAFFLQPGDIRLVAVSTNPAGTRTANLVLNFRVRKNGAKGNMTTDAGSIDNIITKTLPVEYKADTAGVVISCGPVLSEANELARQKFCASLDPNETAAQLTNPNLGVAYWDAANKKCNLRSMDCPWGQVPKEMTSLGGVQCVPLENTIDAASLQQIFDTTPCQQTAGGGTKPFNVTVGGDGRLKITCQ